MLNRNRWLCAICTALALAGPAAAQTPAKTQAAAEKNAKCKAYHKQRAGLEARGVRKLLEQDPAAVAATLPEADRENIRLLIELDERVMFECRMVAEVASVEKRGSTTQRNKLPDLPVRRPPRPADKRQPSAVGSTVPLPERSPRP